MTRAESKTRNQNTRPSQANPGSRSPARSRSRSRAGAAGFGGGLASPRDRARVRDRNAAERARVEEVLASAPLPVDRRPEGRWSTSTGAAEGLALPTPTPTPPAASPPNLRVVPTGGCPVCTSQSVVSDEVMHGGSIRLSECLHCDHRWTERVGRRWSQLGRTMTRSAGPSVVALARGEPPASGRRVAASAVERDVT